MAYPSVRLKLRFILLFVDDLTLLASTVIGLQNQLNALSIAAKRLGLTVNLDKSKVMVFRKGGYLAAKERWFWGDQKLEVVNTYKYLGLFLLFFLFCWTQFYCSNGRHAIRAKKGTIEILRTLKKIGCNSPVIFFQHFHAQIAPTLLYAAEIWIIKCMSR